MSCGFKKKAPSLPGLNLRRTARGGSLTFQGGPAFGKRSEKGLYLGQYFLSFFLWEANIGTYMSDNDGRVSMENFRRKGRRQSFLPTSGQGIAERDFSVKKY